MKKLYLIFMIVSLSFNMCAQSNQKENKTVNNHAITMKFNELTPEEERIIIHKGTEVPYTGEYVNNFEPGTYDCKRCNTLLYNSDYKFDAHCVWPSFDDENEGAVKRVRDADGRRTEILCNTCGAHLGHVFLGEGRSEERRVGKECRTRRWAENEKKKIEERRKKQRSR